MSEGNMFDDIFARYVADLDVVLPEVQAWYDRLKATPKYASGRFSLDDIWPGLLASHPRVIAIFRAYFLELSILIERLDIAEEEEDDEEPEEDDWGTDEEDDEDDEDERPSQPKHVLMEQLRAERPDLFAHFRQFLFTPVGLEDYILVEREVENG